MMVGMTRARNRTNGVGNPALIHLLLEAVLYDLVSHARGADSTLAMIFNRTHSNWRTQTAREDLPHAASGISSHRRRTTDGAVSLQERAPELLPQTGECAARTEPASSGLRWGPTLANRTIRTGRTSPPT
jgi:hypothetical protein